MSTPAKRPDLFSDDPPVLRALLLAAGDDKDDNLVIAGKTNLDGSL